MLGPAHVWALGVGIVLVGEFMGWNFSVGKGGALAALIACWVVGLLYTCVAMIDSEVTSTVAAAGGQYAQAKHIVGPLMAFNVALFLVFAYTMLEGRQRHPAGYPSRSWRQGRLSKGSTTSPSSSSTIVVAGLAQLSRRADDAQRQLRHHRHRLCLPSSSCSSPFSPWTPGAVLKLNELVTPGSLPYGWIGVIAALHFGIWYYLGIEGTTQAAEEVRSPARSLPYGTMAGMITLLIAAAMTWYVCASADALGISRRHLLRRCWMRRKLTGSPLLEILLFIAHAACRRSPRPMAASTMRRAPGSRWAATAICRPGSRRVHPKYRTPYRSILFLLPIALVFAFIADLDQVDHLLDPVGRAAIHLHDHQHHDVPQEVAAGLDPPRLRASRSIRCRRSCCCCCAWSPTSPSSSATARSSIAMIVFYFLDLAVVPLLPLPIRAARRPVHHAVAEAAGLLMGEARPDPWRAGHDKMSEVTSALLAGAIVLALVLHLAWLARRSRNRALAALAADEAGSAPSSPTPPMFRTAPPVSSPGKARGTANAFNCAPSSIRWRRENCRRAGSAFRSPKRSPCQPPST